MGEKTRLEEHKELVKNIHRSTDSIPEGLIISPLKWKTIIRSILKGKNVNITGETGSGKTKTAILAAASLDRNLEIFNIGDTQDPRTYLLGNTQYSKEEGGTFFNQSRFVEAIQGPNDILLDELSRGHPEAWNILLPVLDPMQKFLRLADKIGSPIINVHPGCSFIATSNVGSKYTATRIMDRALVDRFITVEMEELTMDQEYNLLKYTYPNVNEKKLKAIARLVGLTRKERNKEDGQLEDAISTRMSMELGDCLNDDFSISEAAEMIIYPLFDKDNGDASDRTYVMQLVQSVQESITGPLFDPLADVNGSSSEPDF